MNSAVSVMNDIVNNILNGNKGDYVVNDKQLCS